MASFQSAFLDDLISQFFENKIYFGLKKNKTPSSDGVCFGDLRVCLQIYC